MTVWRLYGRLPSWSHMPERKQPVDLRQPPAPNRFRFATTIHQGLEVAFQVGVAQRPSLGREPAIR